MATSCHLYFCEVTVCLPHQKAEHISPALESGLVLGLACTRMWWKWYPGCWSGGLMPSWTFYFHSSSAATMQRSPDSPAGETGHKEREALVRWEAMCTESHTRKTKAAQPTAGTQTQEGDHLRFSRTSWAAPASTVRNWEKLCRLGLARSWPLKWSARRQLLF